jgi:AraC-like DNA-binding protein
VCIRQCDGSALPFDGRDLVEAALAFAREMANPCRMDAKSPLLSPDQATSPDEPVLTARLVRQNMPRITPVHAHPHGQLVAGSAGLLTIETAAGRWVVGPEQGIWIPPHASHELCSHGPFFGWSLYLAPAACTGLPAQACVLGITALLQSLAERVAEWPPDAMLDAAQKRLAAVIIDEIAQLPREAVALPAPADPRLQRVARAIADNPANLRDLQSWAQLAAMSTRSLTRRFTVETGMSLSMWQQRARLLAAEERLARGEPIIQVAGDVGYDSPSAFSAAFRRTHGCSPTDYVTRLRTRSPTPKSQ